MDECTRLAREGERVTRLGDALKGIDLLERALAVGIDDVNDLPLLSAIYSQLGNAYYAQKLYDKALTYHGNDLMLSRIQKDLIQQAKAYSNMSATYTMLNDFNQAVACADNVICLGRKLEDKGLECRGLYNLGLAHLQNAIKGNLENMEEVNAHLLEAVKSFEKHLEIAKDRKDEILCSLAIGNLGNAHFYLNNYGKSIAYHIKRLDAARSVGDKSSMRRSFTNMGNAYVLLGNHDEAAKCYRFALSLAIETGRKNLEAQLFFSLGTVDTLRKNYSQAVPYYVKHLRLARQLNDNAGESRANSSLAAAFAQLNDLPKALYFLVNNYTLAKKLGDDSMKKNTLKEIKELIKKNPTSVVNDDHIFLDSSFDPDNISTDEMVFDSIGSAMSTASKNRLEVPSTDVTSLFNTSALSMPNLSMSLSLESFIRDCARGSSSSTPKRAGQIVLNNVDSTQPTQKDFQQEISFADAGLSRVPLYKSMPHIDRNEEEDDESYDDFMDRIAKVQGNRIDDQRASPKIFKDRTNSDFQRHSDNLTSRSISDNPETILDLIESIQGRRMNEQRADLVLPGLNNPKQLLEKINFGNRRNSNETGANDEEKIDECLYELIVQSQADRLDDQRSELGGRLSSARVSNTSSVNEEIVSDLVQKMQVGRIDGQRAILGGGSRGTTPNRDEQPSQLSAHSSCDAVIIDENQVASVSSPLNGKGDDNSASPIFA